MPRRRQRDTLFTDPAGVKAAIRGFQPRVRDMEGGQGNLP